MGVSTSIVTVPDNSAELINLIKDAYRFIALETRRVPSFYEIYDYILNACINNNIGILRYSGALYKTNILLENLAEILEMERVMHMDANLKLKCDPQRKMFPNLYK
ncbi:MAG: hypothetical protein ACRCX2_32085 [Paraclostridium sp.]